MVYAETRIKGDKDGGGMLNDFDNCPNFYNPINPTVTRTGSAMFRLMLVVICGWRKLPT